MVRFHLKGPKDGGPLVHFVSRIGAGAPCHLLRLSSLWTLTDAGPAGDGLGEAGGAAADAFRGLPSALGGVPRP